MCFADKDDIDGIEALIDERTKAVFCESIGNPSGGGGELGIPGYGGGAHAQLGYRRGA